MINGYRNPFDEVVLAIVRKGEEPMSLRQYGILFALENAENDNERTIRYLAATLNISKPAVSRALDTLEKRGFAKRRRDKRDGRNIFIDIIRPDNEAGGWLSLPKQHVASM